MVRCERFARGIEIQAVHQAATPAYAQSTYETNNDALYCFKGIPAGPHRGFLLHYRYALQTQSGNAN
jgi:hypothetical protein